MLTPHTTYLHRAKVRVRGIGGNYVAEYIENRFEEVAGEGEGVKEEDRRRCRGAGGELQVKSGLRFGLENGRTGLCQRIRVRGRAWCEESCV